eukprot:COSAG06_NODE_10596_length_1652_cov_0.837090_1_plen_73_part_10
MARTAICPALQLCAAEEAKRRWNSGGIQEEEVHEFSWLVRLVSRSVVACSASRSRVSTTARVRLQSGYARAPR